MSPVEDNELKKELDEWLAHGWIEPAPSAFGSGVLFASKHDGGLRVCIDYRRLKELTVKKVYPMPRLDECIDRMAGSSIFTKMDQRSGLHQILVFPEHRQRTAFQTRWGTFQYCSMPFGL